MALVWLCTGLIMLAAGTVWMKKSLLAIAGRAGCPTLIYGLISLVLSGFFGSVVAIGAAIQGQSAFLIFFVLAFCVYYAAAASAVCGLFRLVPVQFIVCKREIFCLILALIYLSIAGSKVLYSGYSEVELSAFSGVIFLGIFVFEIFLLLVSSMNGYQKLKKKKSQIFIFDVILTVAGFCLMVVSALLIVGEAELVLGGKLHPALLGLIFGIIMSSVRGTAAIQELNKGGRRFMSLIWGPASLLFCGGLGISCLIQPITISYTAEVAILFALLMVLFYAGVLLLKKKSGRIFALILLMIVLEAVGWLVIRLANGFY